VRLFVALVPPPEATAELDAVLAPLRPDWPGLRWTSQDAWHVTLTFLGEVNASLLEPLAVRLARAAGRHPPQDAAIGGAGAFPSAAKARVLWAAVIGDRKALTALAWSAAAAARRAGAPPDEVRPYRPHLTIGRCRQPADLRPLVSELHGFAGRGWTAGQMQLIRSHPGPRPFYETIASWPLGAPRPGGR